MWISTYSGWFFILLRKELLRCPEDIPGFPCLRTPANHGCQRCPKNRLQLEKQSAFWQLARFFRLKTTFHAFIFIKNRQPAHRKAAKRRLKQALGFRMIPCIIKSGRTGLPPTGSLVIETGFPGILETGTAEHPEECSFACWVEGRNRVESRRKSHPPGGVFWQTAPRDLFIKALESGQSE